MDLFLDPKKDRVHQRIGIDNKNDILNPDEPTAQDENHRPGEKVPIKSRYKCESCDMSYSKRCYLSNHMEREHSLTLPPRIGRPKQPQKAITDDDPRPYKCDICVKEYTLSKHLVRHKRSHKQQYCDHCQKSFSNISDHMRKEHDIELPRPFECDICSRTYRTKSNLQAHMKIHIASNRVFECSLCFKRFFYATDLRKHLRTHSQQRSVICDICGDGFKSVDTLRTHLRRHTGERPYQCQQCDRSFTTGNSLEIHMRTHTGERPYSCDVCQKKFSDSSTLFVHKRLHTGENPYVCHLCGRRTKQASNLRSHYKHFHKNTDITGRQIRLNSKIFGRFTQTELESNLQKAGDLMGLLAKGMEDYTKEQNEKFNATEQKLKESLPMLNQVKQAAKKEDTNTQNYIYPSLEEANKMIQQHMEQNQTEPSTVIQSQRKNVRATPGRATKEKNDTKSSSTYHTNLTAIKSDRAETEYESAHDDTVNTPIYKQEPAEEIIDSYQQSYVQTMESVFVDIKVEKNDNEWGDAGHFDECFETTAVDSAEDFDKVADQSSDITDNCCYTWTRSTIECVKNEIPDTENTINFSITDHSVPETGASNLPGTSAATPPKQEKTNVKTKPKTVSKTDAKKKAQPKKGEKVVKKCLLCQRNYQNHRTHILTYHSEIERPYECFICHKNYKKIEHLRFHFRTHRNERNFICHLCGDAYLLNSDLTKHIYNRHSNIRPFVCELCSKGFKNRHAMQIHQRVHSGEKPFICSTCSEAFAAMSSLKIHERRHTGERPYVCNYCQKGFSDHSTHRQHVRIHTGEKPYVCHLCGRRTTQAGNLKSHYRHFHKLIVKNVSMYVERDEYPEDAPPEKVEMDEELLPCY